MGVILFLMVGFICVGGGLVFSRLVSGIVLEDKERRVVLFGFGVGWTAFCMGLYLFLQERML